ncbi:hypothetical protein [Streptomyces zingiberis]|uniref:Lipoprotein n=1 Tax=Streptomyces zingiberis TaxID=2053010 RepID=A0ABX1C468_9ACTN|nr:hypothetical protein [Streptomyces zingiberis]NJQ01729.1 hypothetical protein [Streptomyces zingiberis]
MLGKRVLSLLAGTVFLLAGTLSACGGLREEESATVNAHISEEPGYRPEIPSAVDSPELPPSSGPQQRPTPGAEGAIRVSKAHSSLMRQAARVSSAELVLHRDMWDFLTAQAGNHAHFQAPMQISGDEGERVGTTLSGRSLTAVLASLYRTIHTAEPGEGDQELAAVLYDRIKDGLASLGADGEPVTITLDDGSVPAPVRTSMPPPAGSSSTGPGTPSPSA